MYANICIPVLCHFSISPSLFFVQTVSCWIQVNGVLLLSLPAVIANLMLLWATSMGLSPGFVVANSQLLLVQRQPRSARYVPWTHHRMVNMWTWLLKHPPSRGELPISPDFLSIFSQSTSVIYFIHVLIFPFSW
jgi:hypothetical protein